MKPLVSCIMPTWNRRQFIPAAIDCFQKQTYPNRELVIVDDSDDPVKDLVPIDGQIRYFGIAKRQTTGEKRNTCNRLSRGSVICHWDDDDWSAPGRIQDQVARLQATRLPVTGYGRLLFWDRITRQVKEYVPGARNYVCGTTLCYLKEFWRIRRFQDKQKASDNSFLQPILCEVASADARGLMVARIHDCHHTSPKDNIKTVSHETLPCEFWQNEKLIIDLAGIERA